MRYVIHQRHYQYNDEFTERKGRSIVAIKSFFRKEDAMRRWANLERVYAQTHYRCQSSKNYIDLNLEPLTTQTVNQEKLSYIVNKLKACDLITDDWIQKYIHADLSKDDIWDLSTDIPLVELPDTALLDVLTKCDINRYVVSEYNDEDSVYALYFYDYGLSDSGYRGYMTYWMDAYDDCVVYEDNPDLLFTHSQIKTDSILLVTKLSDDDKRSALLQLLLNQYQHYFIIFEDNLYFGNFHKNSNHLTERMTSLRAVNELLTYPFFVIKKLTAEAFFAESIKSNTQTPSTPQNIDRFKQYLKNKD